MSIFEGMKVAIVIASLYAATTQIWQFVKLTKIKSVSAWVHLGLGIMSIYWGAYYLRSVLDFPPFNAHQVYIRGPLLITIVLFGAAGAYAVRRIK